MVRTIFDWTNGLLPHFLVWHLSVWQTFGIFKGQEVNWGNTIVFADNKVNMHINSSQPLIRSRDSLRKHGASIHRKNLGLRVWFDCDHCIFNTDKIDVLIPPSSCLESLMILCAKDINDNIAQ